MTDPARFYIRRRGGSMALLFCVVFSTAMLLCCSTMQAAGTRETEVRLARSMASQIQASLAGCDLEWRQYGLFGFLTAASDPGVFRELFGQSLPEQNLHMILLKPVIDREVLEPQIIRYMKLRLPFLAVSELMGRISQIRQPFLDDASLVQVSGSANCEINGALPDMAEAQKGNFVDQIRSFCSGCPSQAVQYAASQLFGSMAALVKDEACRQLESVYRQYAAEWLGCGADSGLSALFGVTPDFLEPASLTDFAVQLEKFLNFPTGKLYEKICLAEYILGHFRPAVQMVVEQGKATPLATLDGRLYKDMPETRKNEAEQILVGTDKPETAGRIVRIMMTSLRSFVHLTAILSDSSQTAALRTSAVAISAAMAAVSSGTLSLDPQIVFYLLVAGKAIKSGFEDYRTLAAGGAVAIYPSAGGRSLPVFYKDYLRLFLLPIPQEQLVERTSGMLTRLLPGPAYAGLRIQADMNGRVYQMAGEYH
jgi:hypothetical protein